jgi:hypothetical protein
LLYNDKCNTTDVEHKSIDELQKIIDVTYHALVENKLDSIPELLEIHKKIMYELNTCETDATIEYKELLSNTLIKTNNLIDLIQTRSQDIKKQLMVNRKRQLLKNTYLQSP